MNETSTEAKICPYCGNEYQGKPALSRLDNKTLICTDCGIKEALTSIGLPLAEQEEILELIHKTYQ